MATAYTPPAQAPRDPTNVLGRRILAYIVDVVLVSAVYAVVFAIIAKSYKNAPSNACTQLEQTRTVHSCFQVGSRVYYLEGGSATPAGLAILFAFLNSVLLTGLTGASIGKFICGIRVVDMQGQICGFWRAGLRWVMLLVDTFPYCFPLVGLITVSVSHPRKRVGDMAAGTTVVATADVGTPIATPPPAYAGYAPPGAGWGAPAQPPGWAAPGQQPQPPAWGAPPAPPPPGQPPAWGAPPAQQQPPAWGAPPAQQPPPAWGAPPAGVPQPTESTPWDASTEPERAAATGATETPPAVPGANPWGAPPPASAPPPPPPDTTPPPPAPPAAPASWGTPPAQHQPPAAPSSWGTPPEPTAQPEPPPPAPPPVEPPPPEHPDTPPPAPQQAPPPSPGESWWDRAVSDEDDEPKQ